MRLVFLILSLNIFLTADILDSIKLGISTSITYAKEKSEITPLQAEIISIDMDLDRAYKIIGKKYVEYISKNNHKNIGVNNLLEKLKPLLKKKENLEKEILNIKSKYNVNNDFNDFNDEIDKLDKNF